ncbi:hypothetical protein Sjap_013828 [Stephania japonica]|uniref:Uncharacterized protein n=1 Tax=Stephania japonica TaxID=461633 RepID=A0AAP0P1N8_9MAGN
MKTSLIILIVMLGIVTMTTSKARVLEESKSASHEDQTKEINNKKFVNYNGKEVSVNKVDDDGDDDDSSNNHSRGSSSTTHRSISIDDYRRMFRDVPGRP